MEYQCNCLKAWWGVTPPPPCPAHGPNVPGCRCEVVVFPPITTTVTTGIPSYVKVVYRNV